MRTVKLGRTELTVSEMGLGTVQMANLYKTVSEAEAVDVAVAAAEHGITLFDSSPYYGYGLAELRLGSALRYGVGDEAVISTKIGRHAPRITDPQPQMFTPFVAPLSRTMVFDYSYDGALISLEHSLLRLGVERIDIALIHDVDVHTHGADAVEPRYAEAMDGAYKALDSLRSQGLVSAIGVGVNEADMATRFITDGDFDTVLLAGRYSLLEQPALDAFLPKAEAKGVAVMLGGIFNSGILATGPGADAKYDYKAASPQVLEKCQKVEAVCARHGVGLRDAAIRFALSPAAVATVIVGAASRAEVTANVLSLKTAIPDALWDELRSERLLPEAAPTPSLAVAGAERA